MGLFCVGLPRVVLAEEASSQRPESFPRLILLLCLNFGYV